LSIIAYPGNIKKVTKDWVDEDGEGGGRKGSLERVGRGKRGVTRKGGGSRMMKIG